MVTLSLVQASNANIKPTFPSPVAVFVGATAGIGAATLKAFVRYTTSPKIYLIGRSQSAADSILQECKTTNPSGTYTFLAADVSLLHNVDDVCTQITQKEKKIDFLILSCGYLRFGGRVETKEGLDDLLSLRYYARLRFITNLLPLHPSHIVSINGGGNEGPLIESDLDLSSPSNYGTMSCTNHAATMTSLAFEHLAEQYPSTSFVHAFPGVVKTGIFGKGFSWWVALLMEWIIVPLLTAITVPVEEVGERQLFHATSARYPPRTQNVADAAGVKLPEKVEVAANGQGAYLLDWNGEVKEGKCMKGYREREMGEVVWKHTLDTFERVEGKTK